MWVKCLETSDEESSSIATRDERVNFSPASYAFHFFISYTTREEEVTLVKQVIDSLVERLKKAGSLSVPRFTTVDTLRVENMLLTSSMAC